MGEEAKQEQATAEEKKEEKAEEKTEENKEQKPQDQEKEEPKPPSPLILYVDLHCAGCAKKIEKTIMRIRGVEGVEVDMAKNEVTIKGIVEPQAVCMKIMKRTKRRAKVLSPLPASEGEPIPEVVTSQVTGLVTVELKVNMHCEACAEQLKRKLLKMRGVQTVVTELSSEKVMVTGTMDADKLVAYVYRRTKKQARIVPQPEPEPEKKEENKEAEKPAEEAKPEEKKEDNGEKKEDQEKPPEEAKKEDNKGAEDQMKELEAIKLEGGGEGGNIDHEEGIKRMMYYYDQPLYVIERIPPPQLFSDENPNACCIS
ncbi:heavy metal-associated isoprenylated plant protein 9-like [Juglans microcarpa x Juglans regia]|uniref:heavy metal-associated isoprenylated plant protein 9-like n=1 Tax=Juglans microcarpa x Juglans regia TaxID=2249226 RepID=UPI001B7E4039|nr:heavy metal-associated isoprenylated plant protein 9-like [Juglans microcarpa x Juglans regia]